MQSNGMTSTISTTRILITKSRNINSRLREVIEPLRSFCKSDSQMGVAEPTTEDGLGRTAINNDTKDALNGIGNKDYDSIKYRSEITNKISPLITVITVVFNGANDIEETIKSVINQTYSNIEYIIIDGGSTDGTLAIIKKYANDIAYWESNKDNGIYDAMNRGIELATGDWINFMNSGDRFFDKDVLSQISVNLSSGLIYGDHAIYKNDPVKYKSYVAGDNISNRNLPYCHQSMFAESLLLKKIRFDCSYKIASDYNQYLIFKKINANIKHVSVTVALYLDGGLSTRSRLDLILEYYKISKQHALPLSYIFFQYRNIKYYASLIFAKIYQLILKKNGFNLY